MPLEWEEDTHFTTSAANTFELNEIVGIQRTGRGWVSVWFCVKFL
jgi:hypothetical protein